MNKYIAIPPGFRFGEEEQDRYHAIADKHHEWFRANPGTKRIRIMRRIIRRIIIIRKMRIIIIIRKMRIIMRIVMKTVMKIIVRIMKENEK